MRFWTTIIFVLAAAACNPCYGEGYTIRDVIEVGPLNRSPMSGPIKWSPDGTKAAYFAYEYLMITDTLGHAKQVCKLDIERRRFEWLSDRELLICTRQRGNDTTRYTLVQVDITTGEQSVIRKHERGSKYSAGTVTSQFKGPYKTLQGNVYYISTDESPQKLRYVESKYNKAADPSNDYIYRLNTTGLYVVRFDGHDSVKAISSSYSDTVTGYDRTHWFYGGVLYDLRDSTLTFLDEFIGEYPEGTKVCGFPWSSLNPNCPEILFTISCDDGVNYIVDRLATFDYASRSLTVLDTLINIHGGMSPAYSPDGRNIAFFADGNLYLIMREGKPCDSN